MQRVGSRSRATDWAREVGGEGGVALWDSAGLTCSKLARKMTSHCFRSQFVTVVPNLPALQPSPMTWLCTSLIQLHTWI